MTQLQLNNLNVSIDKGQLSSFKKDDYEYIHQVGSPGWGKSDDEMFPIIGPTDEANFKVKTPKGEAILDQHGLLRELTYALLLQQPPQRFLKNSTPQEARLKIRNSLKNLRKNG